MYDKSKLIILRGPSGSGKSTIAKALIERTTRDIVIIEHDYYRVKLLYKVDKRKAKKVSLDMLIQNALTALENDCDVIVDGIFTMPKYAGMFEELFNKHPRKNFIFNFDTSYEETLRRHETRTKSVDFGEVEMKAWYKLSEPTGYSFEERISESSGKEEIIARILKTTKLA